MIKTLVIAAHPDDEVLGMGGIICRLSQTNEVGILFIGNGVSSRVHSQKDVDARREAAYAASKILGSSVLEILDFPDNMLDAVPLLDIAKAIERWKAEFKPTFVFTHHLGDLNIDHRRVAEATLTAFRPQPREDFTDIYSFEVNSSTEWALPNLGLEFKPDTYFDISSYVNKLESALECYQMEMRSFPHPRSDKAIIAKRVVRGTEVGVDAAEAFVTLRRIIRSNL